MLSGGAGAPVIGPAYVAAGEARAFEEDLMERRLTTALLVLAVLVPVLSFGQMVVRRGDDPEQGAAPTNPFASPLIVEVPFPALWDQTTRFTKMKDLYCEGVRIYDITFKVIDKKHDDGTLRSYVDLATAVGDHALVSVQLEVVGEDGEVIVDAFENGIKTRQGARLRRTLLMPVTRELLERRPAPTLRITLRAQPR